MNKRELIGFVLVGLLLGVFFVSATLNNKWVQEVGSINIGKGWNLVYGFLDPTQLEGQILSGSSIKAIYGFVPTTQKYVRLFPSPSVEDVETLQSMEGLPYDFEDDFSQTAFWVYSDSSASTEYWLQKEPKPLSERKLFAGWNFVGITSEFVGKTLMELKGDCTYSAIYFYGSEAFTESGWIDLLNNPNFVDKEKFVESNLGMGLAIKVSSNCKLGVNSEVVSPPSLP